MSRAAVRTSVLEERLRLFSQARLKNGVEQSIDEFADSAPPRRRNGKRKDFRRAFEMRLAEARERVKSKGNWAGVEAGAVVGLYAALHETVYGVLPDELRTDWGAAVSACKGLMQELFDDDSEIAVEYVRWAMRRAKRAALRAAETQEIRRFGWRLIFASRTLVTDYRADIARHERRR